MFHATPTDEMSETAKGFDEGLATMLRVYQMALTQKALIKAVGRANADVAKHIVDTTTNDIDIGTLAHLIGVMPKTIAAPFFDLKKTWTAADYAYVFTREARTGTLTQRSPGLAEMCMCHGVDVPRSFAGACIAAAIQDDNVDLARAVVTAGFVPTKDEIESGARRMRRGIATPDRTQVVAIFTDIYVDSLDKKYDAKRLKH